MEDSLGHPRPWYEILLGGVLILVVMEDSLGPTICLWFLSVWLLS